MTETGWKNAEDTNWKVWWWSIEGREAHEAQRKRKGRSVIERDEFSGCEISGIGHLEFSDANHSTPELGFSRGNAPVVEHNGKEKSTVGKITWWERIFSHLLEYHVRRKNWLNA